MLRSKSLYYLKLHFWEELKNWSLWALMDYNGMRIRDKKLQFLGHKK